MNSYQGDKKSLVLVGGDRTHPWRLFANAKKFICSICCKNYWQRKAYHQCFTAANNCGWRGHLFSRSAQRIICLKENTNCETVLRFVNSKNILVRNVESCHEEYWCKRQHHCYLNDDPKQFSFLPKSNELTLPCDEVFPSFGLANIDVMWLDMERRLFSVWRCPARWNTQREQVTPPDNFCKKAFEASMCSSGEKQGC